MTRPFELHRRLNTGLCYPHGSDNTGLQALRDAEFDAEKGSRKLAHHCHRLFRSFAQHHGIQSNEARILLLDTGVRL